jgi:hypothetical protein
MLTDQYIVKRKREEDFTTFVNLFCVVLSLSLSLSLERIRMIGC